jgi:hypothetical protein
LNWPCLSNNHFRDLNRGCAPSRTEQVNEEQDDRENDQDVDKGTKGMAEANETEKPEYQQNSGDSSKHVTNLY